MDTIAIRYKVPKLDFAVTPVGNQTFTLQQRLVTNVNDPSDTGWQTVGTYITNNKGENINNVQLTQLVEGFNYQLKFTNTASLATKVVHFKTYTNTSAGDSPYYNKVLFPNQTYDWFINGVDEIMLPKLTPLEWYYSLTGHKRIDVEKEAYRSMEVYGEDNWSVATTEGNDDEKYMSFLCDDGNAVRLPFGTGSVDANHSAMSVFYKPQGSSYVNVFGFSFFLLEGYEYADLITFRRKIEFLPETVSNYTELWSIRVHPTDRTQLQIVSWVKSTNTETILETVTLTNGLSLSLNKWYNFQFNGNTLVKIYDDLGQFLGSGSFNDNPYSGRTTGGTFGPLWSEDSPIVFGNPLGITTGLHIGRVFCSKPFSYSGENISELNILKIVSSYKFIPKLAYYQNGVMVLLEDSTAISSIRSNKLSLVIKSNIATRGVAYGTVTLKLMFGIDLVELASKMFELKSVEGNTDIEGYDINFEEDYALAMAQLKTHYYTKHGTWGGYNGGVNSNLVYGNGKNALIISSQGDKYNGVVGGVGRETGKGSNYDGYGGPALYSAYNDTRKGQSFRTRVGSVLVSSKYYAYGEMTVRMLIPKGTYGMCPALWFFHYQEYGESDTRYAEWLARGYPRQGNAEDGYYLVVNNEIDIELPSHNIQGTFEDWNQVSRYYFDPKALDTQFTIGLKQTPTNLEANKVGTFRLNNVLAPNLFESWTQISYEFKTRIYPNYSSIKFNNWIGELDSGRGYASNKEQYDSQETYLALMTQVRDIEKDTYADNMFHDYTIKWYPGRTELWIDGEFVRENRAFVPFNVMKYTLGAWFPSMQKRNVVINQETGETREEVRDTDNGGVTVTPGLDPVGTWAGINADYETCHLMVSRITWTPYNNADKSKLEYTGESFPESGLRYII